MEVRELFKLVRSEKTEVMIVREQIEELRMSLLPTAIRYDKDNVQSSPDNKTEKIMAKVDEYERKLQGRLLALLEHQSEAYDYIVKLEVPEQRQVLQLYYLGKEKLYWYEVAKIMNVSEKRLYQIQSEAFESLDNIRVN